MAETLLKIENLTKEYEGQKILDGIHLEVKKGDTGSLRRERKRLYQFPESKCSNDSARK